MAFSFIRIKLIIKVIDFSFTKSGFVSLLDERRVSDQFTRETRHQQIRHHNIIKLL